MCVLVARTRVTFWKGQEQGVVLFVASHHHYLYRLCTVLSSSQRLLSVSQKKLCVCTFRLKFGAFHVCLSFNSSPCLSTVWTCTGLLLLPLILSPFYSVLFLATLFTFRQIYTCTHTSSTTALTCSYALFEDVELLVPPHNAPVTATLPSAVSTDTCCRTRCCCCSRRFLISSAVSCPHPALISIPVYIHLWTDADEDARQML